MKRAFIIHGWGGVPEEGCFPWLKKELEKKGISAFNPLMPEPLNPQINAWVSFLKKQIGKPDEDTILVGHSIGAQTILRYLESLNKKERIGGAVFLAGWVNLTEEAYESEEEIEIGKPWIETPIDWDKVRSRANHFVALFSDDDPIVPISDAEIFRDKLGAKIVIEHGKGHFSGNDKVTKLPILLKEILDISK